MIAAPVEATVGPEGGTLKHRSGAMLVVPPGAVTTATRLRLVGTPAPADSALAATSLGQGFEAGPDGQTFLAPVEIIVPFDPERVPAGTDLAGAQIRMAPHGSSDFVALDSRVDRAAKQLHAYTLHFTQFIPAVNPNPVFITTDSPLPGGKVGATYAEAFAATGGTTPYVWSLSTGSALPGGLSLSPAGGLGGTPGAAGSSSFFVTASDSAGHAVQKVFSLAIAPPDVPGNPVPTIGSATPSSINVTTVDTQLVVTGTNFITTTSAAIDSQGISTRYVSPTRIDATIPASYLATPGTLNLRVYNPTPGGGFSPTSVPITVVGTNNPEPVLTSLSQTSILSGSPAFTLTVTGSGFANGAELSFGSAVLATTVTSSTSASATVPDSLVNGVGTENVRITNPTPGGGASGPLEFRINYEAPFHACVTGWADLDSDPANGCETEVTGVTCLTRLHKIGSCMWTFTVERNVSFSWVYDPFRQSGITCDSPGIARIYNTNPEMHYPYFQGGPDVFTAEERGRITRSGSMMNVTYESGRAAPIGAPLDCVGGSRYFTKCTGSYPYTAPPPGP